MKQIFTKLFLLLLFCSFSAYSFPQDILAQMKNKITGHYDPATDPHFVTIMSETLPPFPMYLHQDVYNAFKKMRAAARRDNIELIIVSAARTFAKQSEIWEYKWNMFTGTDTEKAQKILEYSSMPGTSRHHWGTDIDLCSVEDVDWETPKMKATLKWLKENADKFGFFMPYDDNPERTGYKYEPWHWSYYPMSDYYTDLYRKLVIYDDIRGFSGAATAQDLDVIEKYVFGIATH